MWWRYIGDQLGRLPFPGVPPRDLSDEAMLAAEARYRSRFPAVDKFGDPIPDDVVRASGLYEAQDGDLPVKPTSTPDDPETPAEAPQGAPTGDEED